MVQPSKSKGNRVNIPEPVLGDVAVKSDEAVTQTNLETVVRVPERVLFSLLGAYPLECYCSEIGVLLPYSTADFAVSGALSSPLENPREQYIFRTGRTHIRSRSPRFAAFRL